MDQVDFVDANKGDKQRDAKEALEATYFRTPTYYKAVGRAACALVSLWQFAYRAVECEQNSVTQIMIK